MRSSRATTCSRSRPTRPRWRCRRPSAARCRTINVQVGDVAKVGAVVAVILGEGEAAAAASLRATKPAPASPPFVPAKAGTQSQGLGPRLRGDERSSAASLKPHPMDLFREVRTPERNFGPARIAAASASRRWRAGSPARTASTCRASTAPARMAASLRAMSKPAIAQAPARGAALAAGPSRLRQF